MNLRFLFLASLCVAGVASAASMDALVERLPAQNSAEATSIFSELIGNGAKGVTDVCARLASLGTANDRKVRYAVSGLAKHVTRPGAPESERLAYVNGVLVALDASSDTEVKTFLLNQLQLAAEDEAIAVISAYLHDPELGEPATQALVGIHSQVAAQAVSQAVTDAREGELPRLLMALGALQNPESTAMVSAYLNSADPKVKAMAQFAVANIAQAPAPPAGESIIQAALRPESAAALAEARELLDAGNSRKAASKARSLFRNRQAEPAAKAAALGLIAEARGDYVLDSLIDAVESGPAELRSEALVLAEAVKGNRATKKWGAQLKKLPLDTRAAVVEMLGKRDDPSAFPVLEDALEGPTREMRKAAIEAIRRIGGNEAVALLKARSEENPSQEELLAINAALSRIPGGLDAGEVLSAEPDAEGFVSLFNGKDLTGWIGDTTGWAVEEGAMVCQPGGNIYTAGAYGDFIYRLEFRLTPGANNGVGLRVEPGTHASVDAVEIQVLDDTDEKYADIHEYQFNGSVYGVAPAKRGHLNPVGEWNTTEISWIGNQIQIS